MQLFAKAITSALVMAILTASLSFGQTAKFPVKWTCKAKRVRGAEFDLVFDAEMEKKWRVYSQYVGSGGPLPTNFEIRPSKEFNTVGRVDEMTIPVSEFDTIFMKQTRFFGRTATFVQRIRVGAETARVEVGINYQTCDGEQCLAPITKRLSLSIARLNKGEKAGSVQSPPKEHKRRFYLRQGSECRRLSTRISLQREATAKDSRRVALHSPIFFKLFSMKPIFLSIEILKRTQFNNGIYDPTMKTLVDVAGQSDMAIRLAV